MPLRTAVWMTLACGMCWGQPAGDSKPAGSNVPGAEYPRIHSDLRVTFQLKAPEARRVQLRLGKVGRLDAARHARGELDKVGIKYAAYDSAGTDHEWLTWRRSLREFATKLFRNEQIERRQNVESEIE